MNLERKLEYKLENKLKIKLKIKLEIKLNKTNYRTLEHPYWLSNFRVYFLSISLF
jgi:hypothetical protein